MGMRFVLGKEKEMSNRLKYETSPYLLQHAENPVDWYPWCAEAFEKAKETDKPIFLSIGYSTCHWCHVMAQESFENKATAAILNKYFISIKVDREERPDIDRVYMSVCQAFTGSGGWPMSIFMTWDKKPFLAGTYFPVQPQYGMPGFSDLLLTVAKQWDSQREKILHTSNQVITHLKQTEPNHCNPVNADLLHKAVQIFCDSFDSTYGGFGAAPKFPTPHNLLFLALYATVHKQPDILKMVTKTLTQMRKGGIFDQIGYGFSRYSTDPYFLVPHFEKMLYDNALLMIVYVSVYQITNHQLYLDTAEKTAQYVLREMTSIDGGFYSAQDADSEGIEGKYYTFTLAEVLQVLGQERGEAFSDLFDITKGGNFEGVNIPNLLVSNVLDADFTNEIQILYNYRKNRFQLHLDDKILISWNSMMIAALCILYRVSRDEQYLQAAVRAQGFLEKNLCEDMQLSTSWRDKRSAKKGFLDDYAYYTAACTELYLATLQTNYLEKAKQICLEAVRRFADNEHGGFYLADANQSELFLNPKETYDGAIPSGNSMMAYNFVRLYQLTEIEDFKELAERQIHYLSAQAQDNLAGHSMFLLAKMLSDYPPQQIKIVLKHSSDLEKIRRQMPILANTKIVAESNQYPLVNGSTTFYICKDHTCQPPVNILKDANSF